MTKNILTRIEALESFVPNLGKRSVWIDHHDNRVRIDIDHERGEQWTFENIWWACRSVEYHARQFERVNGTCFISDVRQILSYGPYVQLEMDVKKYCVGLLSLAQFDWSHSYHLTLINCFITAPMMSTTEAQAEQAAGLDGLLDAIKSLQLQDV